MSPVRQRPVADREMEAYAAAHSTPPSDALVAVARSTEAWSDRSQMMIDGSEARFLALLVAVSNARRILEIGTFTGYSAIAMAEALPDEGHITTLELDAAHAARAAENIAAAGQAGKVAILEGPALVSLASLEGPFDLVFIDADKSGYPAYYEAVVPLLPHGGLIVADNVLRNGRALDTAPESAEIAGIREFNDKVVADLRVEAVMLTIRDGVTLIRRR